MMYSERRWVRKNEHKKTRDLNFKKKEEKDQQLGMYAKKSMELKLSMELNNESVLQLKGKKR